MAAASLVLSILALIFAFSLVWMAWFNFGHSSNYFCRPREEIARKPKQIYRCRHRRSCYGNHRNLYLRNHMGILCYMRRHFVERFLIPFAS